jgi:2-hydroxychromene-2-carboxylate isomerase
LAPTQQPVFYYDLGSPHCYVVAEQVMRALPVVPEWEPVRGHELGHGSAHVDRNELERIVRSHDLLPMCWPELWPPDGRRATLAAAWAKQIGRAVAFSLACFRQVFAAGRDLGDDDTILIAAAACEIHPTALLKAIELRSTQAALAHAEQRALAAGVRSLPALQFDDRVFTGPACIEEASSAMAAAR